MNIKELRYMKQKYKNKLNIPYNLQKLNNISEKLDEIYEEILERKMKIRALTLEELRKLDNENRESDETIYLIRKELLWRDGNRDRKRDTSTSTSTSRSRSRSRSRSPPRGGYKQKYLKYKEKYLKLKKLNI
jgi:hypothetical protein